MRAATAPEVVVATFGGTSLLDNATALVDPLPRPLDSPPLGDGLPLSDVAALVGAPPGCVALLGAIGVGGSGCLRAAVGDH